MTIKDFSGGLDIRPHAQLIPSRNSIRYTDCDNEEGILKPTLTRVPSGIAAKKRWIYFKDCDKIISSDNPLAYWAEFDHTMYETNGTHVTQEDCAGVKRKLGIDPPDHELTLTKTTDGDLCGTYKYVYTYYNSLSGEESAPNPLSLDGLIEVPKPPPGTTPPPTVNPERERFLKLGEKGTALLAAVDYSEADEIEKAIVELECLVDHSGPWTIAEFIAFRNEFYAIYHGSLPMGEKLRKIDILFKGTIELHELDPSYRGVVEAVEAVLEGNPYEFQLAAKFQNDAIKELLENLTNVQELHGPEWKTIVDDLILVKDSTPPTTTPAPTDDLWRNIQYRCVLDLALRPDGTTTDAVCHGGFVITGFVPSTDPHIDMIRLYRIGGTLPGYNMVAEFPVSQTSYTDKASDSSIAGNHVLDTFSHGVPPPDAKYITENNAMLFAASGTKLHFSDPAKPHAWAATNYLEFSHTITGIGAVQNGLLVFTRFTTYIVTGTYPENLAKFMISDSQGCVNHDTIAFGDNVLLWLSTDGVCTSSGGFITVVTQELMGRLELEDTINGWVWDKMYFLGHKDGTLILDNRYQFCIRTLDYSGWYGSFKDELYMQENDELSKMFSGVPEVMKYKSPVLTEGRLSEYKMFKDIYISFQGDIHVKIILHGHQAPYQMVVFDDTLLASEVQEDIKTRGNEMGYGISFEIEGTGEVHEIDFRAAGRENGK